MSGTVFCNVDHGTGLTCVWNPQNGEYERPIEPRRPDPTVPTTGASPVEIMLVMSPFAFVLGYLIACMIHSVLA